VGSDVFVRHQRSRCEVETAVDTDSLIVEKLRNHPDLLDRFLSVRQTNQIGGWAVEGDFAVTNR
jgi:hypothetical protein